MRRLLIFPLIGRRANHDAEGRRLSTLVRYGAELEFGVEVIYNDEFKSLNGVASDSATPARIAYVDDPFARSTQAIAEFDGVLCSSNFVATRLRESSRIVAVVLPGPVDRETVVAATREGKFLTFVDPSVDHGVFAFARIADELGRRRPDIPILVVEGTGTEATVAACGLDLRRHGNVFFMAATIDPRRFYRSTKVILMPALGCDGRGMLAVEAMANDIPVIASDRGALPEFVGAGGFLLPLPERLSPATVALPTADEVRPWVDTIIRMWDEPDLYDEMSTKAAQEARRWTPAELLPRYIASLDSFSRRDNAAVVRNPHRDRSPGRAGCVVLVPHLNGIEWDCEQSLRKLEDAGVTVVRSRGSSQIDVARNQLTSDALHDGFESIFFIDADIGFDPADAYRLIARPERVVAGVYAKKGRREMATRFADGIEHIEFGPTAPGLYPLKYAATGFLRIRATVLRRMISGLGLPLCNAKWGRGVWPFFQPIWVPDGDGGHHYLGEDWAFSHRLAQIGGTPLADTSIRLWHYGQYAYGWEDAGEDRPRRPPYRYHPTEPNNGPVPMPPAASER